MAVSLALAAIAGCKAPASTPAASSPAPPVAPSRSIANRVWAVRESTAVAAGTLYVFLADGTLVITSDHSRPSLGRWSPSGRGLIMVEEGLSYDVDIVELSAEELTIRSHNPGEPVVTTLVLASSSPWPG